MGKTVTTVEIARAIDRHLFSVDNGRKIIPVDWTKVPSEGNEFRKINEYDFEYAIRAEALLSNSRVIKKEKLQNFIDTKVFIWHNNYNIQIDLVKMRDIIFRGCSGNRGAALRERYTYIHTDTEEAVE